MKQRIHYNQFYAPVASLKSIIMLLIIAAVHGWHTNQHYYVAVFPQAPVEAELCMKIPKWVDLQGKISCDHVLKLHKNTYA